MSFVFALSRLLVDGDLDYTSPTLTLCENGQQTNGGQA
jgi:hypothetical protein